MTKQVQEDSAAQATLRPQNKSAMLNSALMKLSGMSIEDLSKFHNEVIAQIGHEADGVGAVSGSNQSSLNMHPSAASTAMKESAVEDLALVLGEGDQLSEELRANISTLFEATIETRLGLEREALVEEMNSKLDEAYTEMHEEMTSKVDAYLDSVVESWMAENEVAIESALRNELMDDFIVGLQKLFSEHYMNVPEDKVEVVEELAAKVAALEERLDATLTENAEFKKNELLSQKSAAIAAVCEGMVLTSADKLRSLAENVEFDGDVEAFTAKVNVIKESVAGVKAPTTGILVEESDPEASANGNAPAPGIDPNMARYMSAISRNIGQR